MEKTRNKRKSYAGNKSSAEKKPYAGNKSSFERKSNANDKPSFERKPNSSGKPLAEKKTYANDKPSFERKTYAGKKSYNGSKPSFERKSYSGSKPAFEKKSYAEAESSIKPAPPVITVTDGGQDDDQIESLIMEGRKAVLEALNHEKPVDRILIRKEPEKQVEGTLRVIVAKAREQGIVVQEVSRFKLDELSETGHHQGVMALCPAVGYVEISDMLEAAKAKGEPPFIIVLDGVTDPHNLGAVIRTAEAGGAHGIVIPKRRAVGLTGTVAKTSAGAIAHLPVARVTNISHALKELKSAGLWVACADMNGQSMYDADMTGPIALVVGAEGVGVSRLVAEQSDFIVNIPMFGKIASLNVSVAAGVLIYEIVRRRSR